MKIKRIFILLCCTAFLGNAYASTKPSGKLRAKVVRGYKKPRKKNHLNKTNDPLLDAINTKSTTTSRIRRPKAVTAVVSGKRLGQPRLLSYAGYVIDANSGEVLVSKNEAAVLSIASISKLMTAMVLIDSGADLDGYVVISDADIDRLKNTYSRLSVGMQLKRRDLLLLALMSSENRAAHALSRTAYLGGTSAFVTKMNEKAKSLGMTNTHFVDPSGLTPSNKSTVRDVVKMVKAAYAYDLIRQDTTTKGADVVLRPRYMHHYMNSDVLVRTDRLQIEVSKTGFINEAGGCLALYAIVNNRPVVMAFLRSSSRNGRVVDAMSVQRYIEQSS